MSQNKSAWPTPTITRTRRLIASQGEQRTERLISQIFGDSRPYAKVRLADVFDREDSIWSAYERNFMIASHFDFLLSDDQMKPVCAVEFDGPHHSLAQQFKRDLLKNIVCLKAGLPLLRLHRADLDAAEETRRKLELVRLGLNYPPGPLDKMYDPDDVDGVRAARRLMARDPSLSDELAFLIRQHIGWMVSQVTFGFLRGRSSLLLFSPGDVLDLYQCSKGYGEKTLRLMRFFTISVLFRESRMAKVDGKAIEEFESSLFTLLRLA